MNIYRIDLNNGVYRHAIGIDAGDAEDKVLSYYSSQVKVVKIERVDVDVILEERAQ